jgi:hypothetical protein
MLEVVQDLSSDSLCGASPRNWVYVNEGDSVFRRVEIPPIKQRGVGTGSGLEGCIGPVYLRCFVLNMLELGHFVFNRGSRL